ncbi:MAG: hypothetical protein JWN73_4403 [Betaproteobacteria bacterium]|nr:hypothetical protein [Betaproteobacteria bacterium]
MRLRPFAAAHWSLLLVLVVMWEALLLRDVCAGPPFYAKAALATATLALALWSNHLARAPLRSLRALAAVALRSAYDLLALGLLLLLLALPGFFLLPAAQCYSDRGYVVEVLASATPLREAVAARALAAGSLAHSGAGLKVGRVSLGAGVIVGGGLVLEDGMIIVVGEKPAVALALTPTLTAGRVEWTCSGFPQQAMPAACR